MPDPAAQNSSPISTRNVPLHDEIARRAEDIWNRSGRPSGRDVEFWLQAERELLGADPTVHLEGESAVSAAQYTEATDANQAKAKAKKRR
jgi:hypothetical protein